MSHSLPLKECEPVPMRIPPTGLGCCHVRLTGGSLTHDRTLTPLLHSLTPLHSTQLNSLTVAVMVWIHGGGYTTGQSNDYAGDFLVSRSNQSLVVVTVNYRLAQFGFLASPALQKRSSDGSTGNYGIADQRLALQVHSQTTVCAVWARRGNRPSIVVFLCMLHIT